LSSSCNKSLKIINKTSFFTKKSFFYKNEPLRLLKNKKMYEKKVCYCAVVRSTILGGRMRIEQTGTVLEEALEKREVKK